MKKNVILAAMLFLLAISAFAQNRTDFSGNWELNTVESKLDERMRIESMTMKVMQTEKDITVGTFTKRTMPLESDGAMKRIAVSSAAQSVTYFFEGKETGAQTAGIPVLVTSAHKASMEADGRLNLASTRDIETQEMGALTITLRETWELADEGKTLRVSRTMETPTGIHSSELIFVKKEKVDTALSSGDGISNSNTPKTVSGGVINSKATKLVKPAYPEAAKTVKAGGAVNVQVTIDEGGNIISATAVSGHPLLREASEEAARASTFSPTLLQGVPVKVTGIIVYNFTP